MPDKLAKGGEGLGPAVTMRWALVVAMLWAAASATGADSVAAEQSAGPINDPIAEVPDKRSEPTEGGRGPLRSRLQGATPEEQARLSEERKRISATAAAMGTDPTAVIGYYQLGYVHNTLTNGLRTDAATPTIRLPLTPNLFLQATMPYVWADLNHPRGFTTNGNSDMVVRMGGRLYASENVALFIGIDASFPTASERQLGTGKYTLGPGGGVAIPMARLRSLFFTLAQDFLSIGGDPSRADIHFMQVQTGFNTIWSEHWWTLALMTWGLDWNHNRKDVMNLLGEVGYRFDNHWNVFAGAGGGVVGQDTFLGLDWTVQAGVRWVFRTPLFPERLFESLPIK